MEILQGNQKADSLAKGATNLIESPFPAYSPFMDQYLLVNKKEKQEAIADGNTRGFLTSQLKELQDAKLTSNNLSRIAWTKSSHAVSFHVFSKDYQFESLKLFAYKTAQGRLPTNNRFNDSPSACWKCKKEETNEHVLFHCQARTLR
eukprot:TRINITY_DN10630_c0_g1_i1.p1 TRINITY_DN10630_c0_g1~~TRINITY_DN10630_c0_g1_i1.p1  ORF type:complete len:157 (+),score=47.76 TRINITY_DN10630_c0_g1_i1:33-473(+)